MQTGVELKNNARSGMSFDELSILCHNMASIALVIRQDLSEFCLSTPLHKLMSEVSAEIGNNIFVLFGNENKGLLADALNEAALSGKAELILKLRTKSGKQHELSLCISAIDSARETNYFITGLDVGIYQDRIEEVKLVMASLEKKLDEHAKDLAFARDRAMAASRAKSGFLANMSHELRTPLNAVIGYSEILQEDAEATGNETQVADLKRIQNAGKHLLSLINDVLDLSKIEAGKMGLNLEYFRVDNMVNEVIDTVQPMALKNNTKLNLLPHEDIGVMLSDITKVRQILFNLISNAIKFSENSTVSVICKRASLNGKDHIIIEVEDTGIGMSSEELEKLFEEFFQADNSNAKKWSGTGLGLVISQRFSEMLGGTIKVESELGKGSCFIVSIPVNTAKIRFQNSPGDLIVGPKVDPRLVRFSGKIQDVERRDKISRVLVIDDDPDVRDLMERYLTREGFEVNSACSGSEGISKIKEFNPDVITLDVLMPVMDGWSVLSELKKNPETAKIPVIMLSMLDELDMSFALGASDYMLKPIKRDVLVDTVLKHIRDKENATVLVVDDLEENRNVISRILSSQKINVALAENGLEALAKMEITIPDLILLDLMMPEMDGFKFSEIVRRNEKYKDIPIVVLTARELTSEDISRLSGKVDRIYEKKGTDFESLLLDIQNLVTSKVRMSYQQGAKE